MVKCPDAEMPKAKRDECLRGEGWMDGGLEESQADKNVRG